MGIAVAYTRSIARRHGTSFRLALNCTVSGAVIGVGVGVCVGVCICECVV